MKRVGAILPGYVSVSSAADVLHLASRSVRDLIYRGRVPSLRVGRLHYIRAADLELERRRRLGLRLPAPRPRARRPSVVAADPLRPHRTVDPARRRERAAERAAIVGRWLQRHPATHPAVPFAPAAAEEAIACAAC